MRVIAGLVMGVGLLVLGCRFVRRMMRALGLGLIGGAGLPILYVSLYAAFRMFHLIPQWLAFSSMVAVTAVGVALAVVHDSRALSFLAVLGGLLTPLLASTGEDARDTLFGYLLILDLGVLMICASYLYHRVERKLETLWDTSTPDAPAPKLDADGPKQE